MGAVPPHFLTDMAGPDHRDKKPASGRNCTLFTSWSNTPSFDLPGTAVTQRAGCMWNSAGRYLQSDIKIKQNRPIHHNLFALLGETGGVTEISTLACSE